MLVGFVTALVVFVSEIIMRYFYKRKARLVRDEGPRRIQVQPKKSRHKQVYPETKQSPPPNYNVKIIYYFQKILELTILLPFRTQSRQFQAYSQAQAIRSQMSIRTGHLMDVLMLLLRQTVELS